MNNMSNQKKTLQQPNECRNFVDQPKSSDKKKSKKKNIQASLD